jgi:hypothetical protein
MLILKGETNPQFETMKGDYYRMSIAHLFRPAVILLFCVTFAHANDFPKMTSLRVDSEEIVTRPGKSGSEEQVLVVSGQILKNDRTVLLNRLRIVPDEQGRFRVQISIDSSLQRQKVVEIAVIDHHGIVERAELPIPPLRRNKPFNKYIITPSLAVSHISYQEAAVNLTEDAVTLKLSFSHDFRNSADEKERWSLGVSSYFTALPFSLKNASNSMSYFGLNGELGYMLPLASRRWLIIIHGGASYLTTFVSNSIYGFENMFGPQLYPELRRIFSNGGIFSTYAKYVPNLVQTPISFSSSELAGGISYSPRGTGGWLYSLDFSALNLNQSGITAQSRMISLGIGVSL